MDDMDTEGDMGYAADSIRSQPVGRVREQQPVVEKENGKQEDEDVLSFNFLYYIIQKFKMSDIVDK